MKLVATVLFMASFAFASPSYEPRQLFDDDEDFESPEIETLEEARIGFTRKYWRSEQYQELGRYEKLEQLWTTLVPDENDFTVEPMAFYWKEFPNFFTQKANGSFCLPGDAAKWKRKKTTHTQGVVAKVQWVPVENEQGYTGIYKSGSDSVILRLSETNNLTEATTGLNPSMALKFLLDGRKSENILAMHSMKGTDSWNFLENTMSNRVKPFDPVEDHIEFQTIHKKLLEGARCPYSTATGGIARADDQGRNWLRNKDSSTPYELEFRSSYREALNDEDVAGEVWYRQLQKKIPKGSTIFEVYARTAPRDCTVEESRLVKIAELNLLTDLYTSEFGDDGLYFNHRRVKTDMKIFPKKWKKEAWKAEACFTKAKFEDDVPDTWPDNDEEAEAFYNEQMEEHGCPFAWLLD